MVHKSIDRLTDLRIRQNREFFNVAPELALDILRDVAKVLDDAEIVLYKDNRPIDQDSEKSCSGGRHPETPRRGRFRFSMVGIKIGEFVTFEPTGARVKVATDDSVEYEGRIYKLSPFTGNFLPEGRRNQSGAYQGAKYFSYKGKILDDLRKESETIQSGKAQIEQHDSEV